MDAHTKIAIQASLEAGKAIMEIYSANDFNIELKQDDSPITKADKKANDIINRFLLKTGIPIISEENSIADFEERKHWKNYWIVDPLDGTKEFIKRNGEITVNIALVIDEKLQLGIIYVPETKTLFYANVSEKLAHKAILKNHITSITTIAEIAKKITPSAYNNSITVVGSRSHMNEKTQNYFDQLKLVHRNKTIQFVAVGSSLKFCFLAEGKAHIYPRFSPTMEWDTAAGHAICNAVGIEIIDINTQKPLQYNKQHLLNPNFIAH